MLVAGGLFAGGAVRFGWSRVPVWRRMELRQFVSDFDQTISRTDKVQPALLGIAAGAAIVFALDESGTASLLAALGAGGFLVVLLLSVAIMVPLQRHIVATSGGGTEREAADSEDLEAMRLRWFSGNLGRSLLSVASFALMVVATVV